jgi:putative spermidine/putrescine transport system substrate-binding protein
MIDEQRGLKPKAHPRLAVLLITVLVAGACATGGEETVDTTTATTSGATTTSAAAATTAAPATTAQAPPELTGEVVVSSWGGTLQDAQRVAYWDPFTADTGVTVLEGEGPTQAIVKAQVDSGNPEWDVIQTAISIFKEFGPDYFIPIDYDSYPDEYAQIPDAAKLEHQVNGYTWCSGIVYRTDVYGDNPPTNWVDFWDVENFPGMRGMALDGGVPWNSVEGAWLASGQANRDDLYPTLDVDVAFDKFTELAPNIGKWWGSEAENAQFLAQGEYDMTIMSTSTALEMIQQGNPVGVEWTDAICAADYWYILAGSRNETNAQALIASMQDTERQAEFASLYPAGIPNPEATAMLDPEVAVNLPTYPDNLEKVIMQEDTRSDFWGANREAVSERFVEWSLEYGTG